MSQIFKKKVPQSILFELLEKFSVSNDKYYLINNIFYKKVKFNNALNEFLEILKPYYHLSKQFYVDRQINYTRFTTIIRQLCKLHELHFTSKILYDRSNYSIQYYIYKK